MDLAVMRAVLMEEKLSHPLSDFITVTSSLHFTHKSLFYANTHSFARVWTGSATSLLRKKTRFRVHQYAASFPQEHQKFNITRNGSLISEP